MIRPSGATIWAADLVDANQSQKRDQGYRGDSPAHMQTIYHKILAIVLLSTTWMSSTQLRAVEIESGMLPRHGTRSPASSPRLGTFPSCSGWVSILRLGYTIECGPKGRESVPSEATGSLRRTGDRTPEGQRRHPIDLGAALSVVCLARDSDQRQA